MSINRLAPRRVVTGHDAAGRAVVTFDGPIDTAISMRPGQAAAVLWTTDAFPADLAGDEDRARRTVATSSETGSVFRVIRYDPGVSPRVHRTQSLDYAVVLSGEIDMEMDEYVVCLRAGDFLVQRGTIHNWVNRGTQPCVIAFVLTAAHPLAIDGRPLPAVG